MAKAKDGVLSRSGFLVLLAVSDRPRHGLGIVDEVERRTEGTESLGPGTLYATLKRLVDLQMIAETDEAPDPDEHDTRRRYYAITERGREACRTEAEALRLLVATAEAKSVL